MEKVYVIHCPQGFKDGMIEEMPFVKPMDTVKVPQNVGERMLGSDTSLELVEVLVKNPRKKVQSVKKA